MDRYLDIRLTAGVRICTTHDSMIDMYVCLNVNLIYAYTIYDVCCTFPAVVFQKDDTDIPFG